MEEQGGHRGTKATLALVSSGVCMGGLEDFVRSLVERCVDCFKLDGRSMIARPYGTQIQATKPNEVGEVNKWVFIVRSVVSEQEKSVHMRRLRKFANAALNVATELRLAAEYDVLEIDWSTKKENGSHGYCTRVQENR
eukprot:c11597_g1_i3.p1 GENE.c11597_g1_i3~~c11597_g1_i3.p1  ORF type:complete len:138 (+),score=2.25 c11597_g1_i3:787-1200(+)